MAKKQQPGPSGPTLIMGASQLKKALSYVGQAIKKNPIVPILDNVKVSIQGGMAQFTGSDLQTTLRVTLPVDTVGFSDGDSFLLPHGLMSSLVGQLSDQLLTLVLTTDQTYGATLRSQSGTYKLSGENPLDFPQADSEKGRSGAIISSFTLHGEAVNQLGQALFDTVYSVTNDDLRPAMSGVNLHTHPGGIQLAATNGHQLVRYTLEGIKADDFNVILPAYFARTLTKLLLDGAIETTVVIFNNTVSITAGRFTAECRLIDERFPDYENAIPMNLPHQVTTSRTDLMGALGRVLLVANHETTQIRLSVAADHLRVSAEDLDYSHEGSEELVGQYEGEPMEIGFNGKLLMETLRHLSGETVRIELKAPNMPALLFGDNDNALSLMMPCLLNAYA